MSDIVVGPDKMETIKNRLVSVILVNYNGLDLIGSSLRSLFDQSHRCLEVFLFDNGSTDGSTEYVKEEFPIVRVIELGENKGFSMPNNEGIKKARGQYILTLNPDVVLERDFIEELIKGIETDPRIGWASGKMLKLTVAGKTMEIDCLGHHFQRDRYAKETDHSRSFSWSDYSRPRYVFGASGCAALYRRVMLDDVAIGREYLDEDFFAYWEDVDLDWRAQLRGWKCIYVPTAVGYHMRGGSGLHRRPEVAACYLGNRYLMVIKNDEFAHLMQDAAPFIMRSIRDLGFFFKDSPNVLPLAFKRLLQKVPRALQKREVIQLKRRASSSYIRSLIR